MCTMDQVVSTNLTENTSTLALIVFFCVSLISGESCNYSNKYYRTKNNWNNQSRVRVSINSWINSILLRQTIPIDFFLETKFCLYKKVLFSSQIKAKNYNLLLLQNLYIFSKCMRIIKWCFKRRFTQLSTNRTSIEVLILFFAFI